MTAAEAAASAAWTGQVGAPTRLLLLRHGQTALSVQRRYSGHGDPELTELGLRQAAGAAARLGRVEDIAAVLCSPLRRTRQTAEAVGVDLDHASGVLAAAERTLTDVGARRDTALLDIGAAETGRTRTRAEVVAAIPDDLLAVYERRVAQGKVGAALLRERRCGACRLELDRTFIGQLRSAAPDDVVACEECDAILVRTPESGV